MKKPDIINMNSFHRVDFKSDDLIIGFFKHGNRTAETLTADDMEFLLSYYGKFSGIDEAELSFDIADAGAVQNSLPGMHDKFLRIKKAAGN